jgi:galactokinase
MHGDTVETAPGLSEDMRRTCMHVVQEIKRVGDAEILLRNGDLAAFSRLVFHSHESLRDLLEVSCPEIDWMVKRAQEIEGVLGARMMGSGFGGCTYGILRQESLEVFKKRMDDYERIFGFHPIFYEFHMGGGARIIAAK